MNVSSWQRDGGMTKIRSDAIACLICSRVKWLVVFWIEAAARAAEEFSDLNMLSPKKRAQLPYRATRPCEGNGRVSGMGGAQSMRYHGSDAHIVVCEGKTA